MPLELIKNDETYPFAISVNGGEVTEEDPVFMLRKLTATHLDFIEDDSFVYDGIAGAKEKSKMRYKAGTVKSRKIDYAVRDWKNVFLGGKEAKCTYENKKLLPVDIREKLAKKIDEDNGLEKTEQSEEDEKN